ncbi:MAG: hypothetical protein HRT35_00865 [Algicola sp.]|nr:hypothetical protein [Algicola sp.]
MDINELNAITRRLNGDREIRVNCPGNPVVCSAKIATDGTNGLLLHVVKNKTTTVPGIAKIQNAFARRITMIIFAPILFAIMFLWNISRIPKFIYDGVIINATSIGGSIKKHWYLPK